MSIQLSAVLLPGMSIPEPLKLLYEWIEANGKYVDNSGGRVGSLFPEAEQKAGGTDTERPGGTNIELAAEGNVNMKYWFRHEHPDMMSRLCVFGQSGSEGSMVAFWLDDAGQQKIVHLGSGSGSTLVCTLADNAVDFLRLLAIGYDEICWGDQFDRPPNHGSAFVVLPDLKFQDWVKSTFRVDIPRTASEIVKHPANMGDEAPLDPFAQWVNRHTS